MYKDGSIWSGILIGLAGWIFLSVGGGILGAILFSIGLMSVVFFGSSLYTGKAGSWSFRLYSFSQDTWGLVRILLGNVLGCLIVAVVANLSGTVEHEMISGVISSRLHSDCWEILGRGIGCGILMELAVWSWREKNSILGVLLCVPGFILSGFYHSVADAFYYLTWSEPNLYILRAWGITVLGNFIGCNLRRVAMPYK